MRPGSTGRRPFVLAVVFIIIGVSLVLVGLGRFWLNRDGVETASLLVVTASPTVVKPTATEPILPPPPTSTPDLRGTQLAQETTASVAHPTVTSSPTTISTATPPAPTLTEFVPAKTPTVSPATPDELDISPTPSVTLPPTPNPAPPGLYSSRQRLGVGGASGPNLEMLAGQLGFGWYLNWHAYPQGFRSSQVDYVPMIRLHEGQPDPSGQTLLEAVDALPGALWLIGNEPDVKWQDNTPPARYAEVYHDLYMQLKARDPSCQVAIGGVSQPTPLRLHYLDLILQAYQERYGQPMPVDVWNAHNFVLREERDSWGVDIPPGMADQAGVLREIGDHDNLSIFRQQIVDFRRWMQEHGQQDKPLIVTEYGILMPNEYGFSTERVRQFMLDTFEFFRTAADPALGYPADGYRLVQRWCWFSVADDRYPTGNLMQPEDQSLTVLGKAFQAYASSQP
jgi:hypothetical protein